MRLSDQPESAGELERRVHGTDGRERVARVATVSREDWMLGGVALLLVIDLLFLPWFSVSVGHASLTATATGDPDGLLGIAAVLSAATLIADRAIEVLPPRTALIKIGGSRAETRFVLAAVSAYFVGVKFLLHFSHLGDLDFGFWAALVLTPGLVYLALRGRNARTMRAAPPKRRNG